MPTEQRVITPKKIGAKIAAPEPEAPVAAPTKAKGGKKKLVVIVAAVLVVVAAAAAYFLVLAPKGSSDVPPKPVAVKQLEPHSLNLADGHYLRLGFALELTKQTDLDPAGALDAAIAVFSGRTVAEVNDPQTREQLRAELLAKCQTEYGKDLVVGVKFTDYVTQ